uniref:Globin domain-containing protein n=1 Tax=Craspedostauros australis TaxID=1486917 RepID=A0A7R9ZJP1_9STRA|mmetsp:Transcript_1253/g.3624  ORF Transcript_1253/g.3624 Transcript_1253/m.3624 type:complete len:155 (+) Transcript_1253:334-798(+)
MALVVESWAQVKAIGSNYDEVAGQLLFKKVFEINPDATAFFKFTEGFKTTDEELYKTKAFNKHATGVIRAVTKVVSLLEKNNMNRLIKVLKSVGAAHSDLNLEKAHYDLIGAGLVQTVAHVVGDGFTPETKEAWESVYGVITEHMMKGAEESKN